ncbi:MAG: hypothetical protein VXW78_02050 [Pseudomonadota bacterium]|nr:hypothetical protein [Pseudomonadota bacterium]
MTHYRYECETVFDVPQVTDLKTKIPNNFRNKYLKTFGVENARTKIKGDDYESLWAATEKLYNLLKDKPDRRYIERYQVEDENTVRVFFGS